MIYNAQTKIVSTSTKIQSSPIKALLKKKIIFTNPSRKRVIFFVGKTSD